MKGALRYLSTRLLQLQLASAKFPLWFQQNRHYSFDRSEKEVERAASSIPVCMSDLIISISVDFYEYVFSSGLDIFLIESAYLVAVMQLLKWLAKLAVWTCPSKRVYKKLLGPSRFVELWRG